MPSPTPSSLLLISSLSRIGSLSDDQRLPPVRHWRSVHRCIKIRAVSFCSTFTVLAALVVVLDEASMLSMTFCPPLFHSGDRPHPTCSTPTCKPPWDMFVSRRYEGVQQRPFKPSGLLDRNIRRSKGIAFLQPHLLFDARSRLGMVIYESSSLHPTRPQR